MVEDTDSKKKAFAAALIRSPSDPYKAALCVFPGDFSTCLTIKDTWPHDPQVLAYMRQELDSGTDISGLPAKEVIANEILDVARKAFDIENKLKGYKLFCDVMGMIEKPTTNINTGNNFVDNRRVIVLPAPARNTDDWEADAVAQQAKLVTDARQ